MSNLMKAILCKVNSFRVYSWSWREKIKFLFSIGKLFKYFAV